MEYYLQLIINGLVVGSIYSLVALGFVIIYKANNKVCRGKYIFNCGLV